jgi:hypothetical protein
MDSVKHQDTSAYSSIHQINQIKIARTTYIEDFRSTQKIYRKSPLDRQKSYRRSSSVMTHRRSALPLATSLLRPPGIGPTKDRVTWVLVTGCSGFTATSGYWAVHHRRKPPENGLQPPDFSPGHRSWRIGSPRVQRLHTRITGFTPKSGGCGSRARQKSAPFASPAPTHGGSDLPWLLLGFVVSQVLSRVSNSRIHRILPLPISRSLSNSQYLISHSLAFSLSAPHISVSHLSIS